MHYWTIWNNHEFDFFNHIFIQYSFLLIKIFTDGLKYIKWLNIRHGVSKQDKTTIKSLCATQKLVFVFRLTLIWPKLRRWKCIWPAFCVPRSLIFIMKKLPWESSIQASAAASSPHAQGAGVGSRDKLMQSAQASDPTKNWFPSAPVRIRNTTTRAPMSIPPSDAILNSAGLSILRLTFTTTYWISSLLTARGNPLIKTDFPSTTPEAFRKLLLKIWHDDRTMLTYLSYLNSVESQLKQQQTFCCLYVINVKYITKVYKTAIYFFVICI